MFSSHWMLRLAAMLMLAPLAVVPVCLTGCEPEREVIDAEGPGFDVEVNETPDGVEVEADD